MQGVQTVQPRAEEGEVHVHMQGVPGCLPLDQERVRDGFLNLWNSDFHFIKVHESQIIVIYLSVSKPC